VKNRLSGTPARARGIRDQEATGEGMEGMGGHLHAKEQLFSMGSMTSTVAFRGQVCSRQSARHHYATERNHYVE
jgi:hypothetical protein